MKIAVIGPEDHVNQVISIGRELYSQLHLVPFPYEKEMETTRLVNHVQQNDYKLIYFTGLIPYFLALAGDTLQTPCVYTPFHGTELYRGLFLMKGLADLSRVSIDTISEHDVKAVYLDLGIPFQELYTFEYNYNVDTQAILAFHRMKITNGEASAVLTCIRSVYWALKEAGIPCVRIDPTRSTIILCLDKLELIQSKMEHQSNAFTYGILRIDEQTGYENQHSIVDGKMTGTSLETHLSNHVSMLNGFLTQLGSKEYQFFTTRLMLERYTESWRIFPMVEQVATELGVSLSVGIGAGGSVTEAGANARAALKRAESWGGNAAFIIFNDKKILGPLPSYRPIEHSLRSINPVHLALAKEIHLDPIVLSKVINVISSLGHKEFTAIQLIEDLRISTRRVRRILEKMLKGNLIEVVGAERMSTSGRPARVYRLNTKILSDTKI